MIVEHCYSLLLLHLTFCIELLLMYSCTKFFVNLNGNMVVVGNKFFPLWRHFQKFHTNRCQAHLTRTGMLKYKNENHSLVKIMIIEKTDISPEDDIYSFP